MSSSLNIYRQYAELKWLKSNLKMDEMMLSVDFPKTMAINRDMRSRVPILTMNVLLCLLLHAILIDQ